MTGAAEDACETAVVGSGAAWDAGTATPAADGDGADAGGAEEGRHGGTGVGRA